MEDAIAKKNTEKLFNLIMKGLETGNLEATIQAKCVCVDAREVSEEEYGQKHIVWSHGKVEKEITLGPDMVLITTLGADGKPIIDEKGHDNTYDMNAAKFAKKYKPHNNGHYVQDGTPMLTVSLSDTIIPENGITILPPNWRGDTGTLMRDGLVMFPYDSSLSIEENIQAIKEAGAHVIDWYPNNEPQTYSPCNESGIFLDPLLRKTFDQESPNPKR